MFIDSLFLDSEEPISEVSLHPPHLLDSSGSLTPAALIPFCAYQGNMAVLGKQVEGLDFPVCSHFQPTLLEGQRCYSLNLTSVQTGKTEAGKRAGLVIVIDQGVENHKEAKTERVIQHSGSPLDIEESHLDATSARIHLSTLSSFSDSRSGSYALTALKKMSGTPSFLAQTDDERGCLLASLEDCQAAAFLETVRQECGCLPWGLGQTAMSQVS